MKKSITITILALSSLMMQAQSPAPCCLRTDLIERTDIVYSGGYPAGITLDETAHVTMPVQYAQIATPRPNFSWIVDGGSRQDVMQTAYQIVLTRNYMYTPERKPGQAHRGQPELRTETVWDSGKVASSQSTSVSYGGPDLKPSTAYHWTVMIWNNYGEQSDWSEPKAFKTASSLSDYAISIEPQVITDQFPERISKMQDGNIFVDFGKDAFGRIRLTATAPAEGGRIVLHLGERLRDGKVDRQPFGSCRYRRIELNLLPGTHNYKPEIVPDYRNTHGDAVLMPDYIGEVMPFRYVEIEGYDGTVSKTDISRMYVHHPFNHYSSSFHCSDDIINQVWDLCKYSMEATSFIGYHIDGDRERIPYECDGLVNQLCWYGCEGSWSLSRRSIDHLLDHPTWPTEWILQTVLMAWYDYLYTGDKRLLEARYDILTRHTLSDLAGDNGLISTKAVEQTPELLAGINRKAPVRDIVDWPQGGGDFGNGKTSPGEADYFEFTDYNTVVNAYHYATLVCMSSIAEALGKGGEAVLAAAADEFLKAFNKQLFNSRTGNYRDGAGTDHSALHSNMFPLAFGMVPAKKIPCVADYAQSRGMACSIGNAMFLMNGLYDSGKADYALSLLNATHDRSWYNTIASGSTMTFEAWDDKYKNNQDWNHAWGAAPASVLPHKLLGVEPLSPGWSTLRIKPQVSSLTSAEATVPTIKGPVTVSVLNESGSYTLTADIPANVTATVYVPAVSGKKSVLTVDGVPVNAAKDTSGGFFVLESVGSGHKVFTVK